MGDVRAVVGGLSLTLSDAWVEDEDALSDEGKGWSLTTPEGEGILLARPAQLAPGASLTEQLRKAAEPVARRLGDAQVQAPRRAAIGQVPALVALLVGPKGPVGLVAAAVAGATPVLVVAGWTDMALAKAVDGVLSTARGAFATRSAPPPAGEPDTRPIAGAEVLFPASWRVVPSTATAPVGPAQLRFAVPVAVDGLAEPVELDVLLEVQPGAPLAPRGGLAAWTREAVERLGRSWGPDAKVKVAVAEDYTYSDGSLGHTAVIQEHEGAKLETAVVAHVRTHRTLTVWAAVVAGPWTAGWKATAGASDRHEAIYPRLDEPARALLLVLSCVKARPLPAARPDVAAQLVARKGWSRLHRWSVTTGQGALMSSALGHDRVAWSFAADGTATREAEDSAGFLLTGQGSRPELAGQPGWTGVGVLDDPGTRRAGRFEVRGPLYDGGPLLLLHEEPTGRTRLHALEPKKAGEYGTSKFEGMAIDEQIEGTYQSGSSDSGEYRYREN